MKILISGKHMDVGDSLNAHIETAVRTMIGRQLGDALDVQIVLSKDNHMFNTNISIHVSRHLVVRTHAQDDDPYRSCDKALEKMNTRIQRHKTRLQRKKRIKDHEFSPAQQYVINGKEEDTGEDKPLIIAEMPHEIPSATVGEAVMLMELGDSPAMMFKNVASGHFNVVYRRADGHVGWIDPTMTDTVNGNKSVS